MIFDCRNRRIGAVSLGVSILGAGAIVLAAFPAIAVGPIAAVTTVTCTVTGSNWCVSGNNSSSGIGVIGTSKSGTGLRGTSTSQYGLKATSSSNYAILAQTTTGQAAISASSPSGYGVYGFTSGTSGGIGLYGSSANGYGTYGTTTTGTGYGVVGVESAGGTGAYGSSSSGYGLEGISSTGYGLVSQGGTGTAVYATAATGYGLIARTGGHVAVYANNTAGNGSDITGSYIGLLGRSPTTGYPLTLTDTASNNLFYVDGKGNVSYKGGLFNFSAIKSGATVRTFSPNSTVPTIEDTGTAQLVGGAAVVRLDPTFAASIDTASVYRVFVTPNGETHGLYVATKTAGGFMVRETQGGRSNVTFDYRIIATALGQTGQRMAVTSTAVGGGFGPQAVAPIVPAVNIAAPVQAAPAPPAAP